MNILGVRIDQITRLAAIETVRRFLAGGGQRRIFTPNPEMLVDAYRDENFRQVLNRGDLNLCDGTGLALASRGRLVRIPGTDFLLDICQVAQEQGRSVYLLGTGDRTAVSGAAEKLKHDFPNLRIAGYHPGPRIDFVGLNGRRSLQIRREDNDEVIGDIIEKSPDVLFVAFGHRKQENWIEQYAKELPSVKIAMGVSGALDYLAGKVRRAPQSVRALGLEWLWRLAREPRRTRRIWKATGQFMYLILKSRK